MKTKKHSPDGQNGNGPAAPASSIQHPASTTPVTLKIALRLPAAEAAAVEWCLVNNRTLAFNLHRVVDRDKLRALIAATIRGELAADRTRTTRRQRPVPPNVAQYLLGNE